MVPFHVWDIFLNVMCGNQEKMGKQKDLSDFVKGQLMTAR